MNRKLLLLVAIVIVAAASVAGGYFESTRTIRAASTESGAQDSLIRGFEEALVTVEESYAGSSDLELLGKAAIQGMLKQLDPHSAFFTKSEFDDLQTEQKSRIYGVGVTIAKRSDRVYITSVIPGAPAYRAGVRYGDAIIAIDGQNAEEWTSDQVMHSVRGEKGEQVEITVERPGSPAPITLRIKRDEVKLPSVRNAFMMDQGTGYIALTGGFSSKTDEELTAAIAKLKQDGMRQLILDLRGNPGGLLDQAIEVSKKFLLGGQKILEVRGREERFQSRVHEVPENNTPELMPLVLMINRNTASASEVVAGALQDHDRALIVGENSFGKGLVQSVNRLWGGTGLTLTIAKYYTPTGRSIQRDYSNVSFYDYYLNRNEDRLGVTGAPRGNALFTDTGREVFGGGGITPDVEVKSPDASPVRNQLFFGVFDFVRQLVAGQVTGLREYRISETQYKPKLSQDDIDRYAVNDKVIAAFQQHIGGKPQFAVSEELFNQNLDYIRAQIRREIMTAAYGTEAGDQSYLYEDEQLRAAVRSLDGARTLAENARRARSERQ
ncbi:MAG TPA: S41 family peptidase [Blastocatellia bacterium]|nr:S41 family peptidase [Blastocatellia bacterium]